jgi:hypothetical protein
VARTASKIPTNSLTYGFGRRSLCDNLLVCRTKIPAALDVQSLAYVYSRENPNAAHMAKVLSEDDARRTTSNIAKPTLLAKGE